MNTRATQYDMLEMAKTPGWPQVTLHRQFNLEVDTAGALYEDIMLPLKGWVFH